MIHMSQSLVSYLICKEDELYLLARGGKSINEIVCIIEPHYVP